MGKVKTQRLRRQAKAVSLSALDSTSKPKTSGPQEADHLASTHAAASETDGDGMLPMDKKGKRMVRRQAWLNKIETSRLAFGKHKNAKGKKAAAAVLASVGARGSSGGGDGSAGGSREMAVDGAGPQDPAEDDGEVAAAAAPLLKAGAASSKRVHSRRGRTHTLMKEMLQMQSVLSHPLFRADPMGTLAEHLHNSIAPP